MSALPPSPPPAPLAARVLVAEDDPVAGRMIRDMLEPAGFAVVLAADGFQALDLAGHLQPDALVLDVMMPVYDGFEVCRRVKEDARSQGRLVPVLILTALAQRDARLQGLALGADDYLAKPFHQAELISRVKGLVSTKRLFDGMASRYHSAERVNQLQRDLSTFLIHDFKNPLAAIQASLQLLEERLGDAFDPEAQGFLKDARGASGRLFDMVNTVLDVHRLEEGAMPVRWERLDAERLLATAAAEVEAPAALKQIELEVSVFPPGLSFEGDRELLMRALGNLLSNAIRHSRRGKPLKLSGHVEEGSSRVFLSVVDEAKRIDPAHREHIFRKFGRVETPGTVTPGQGLGLTFCRLAAAAHGGEIWVEDGAVGNRFVLALPRSS
jgi:two-component system sensor histidine kinase/response regulator